MPEVSAQELVRKALEKDELDLLLLGKPEYQFLPKWSPASSDTDVIALLEALYYCTEQYTQAVLRDHLLNAINKIVWTYEGLDPVVCCILSEMVRRSEGRPSLGLPLEEIASDLRQSIRIFSFRLEKDKTGEGAQWPDGLLGDLRRLSRNVQNLGGPSFCD